MSNLKNVSSIQNLKIYLLLNIHRMMFPEKISIVTKWQPISIVESGILTDFYSLSLYNHFDIIVIIPAEFDNDIKLY